MLKNQIWILGKIIFGGVLLFVFSGVVLRKYLAWIWGYLQTQNVYYC